MRQVVEAKGKVSGPYTLMSLKAFGDLVIARTSLAGAPPGTGLAIAHHLVELNNALRLGPVPRVIQHRECSVPALFDLRRRGIGCGLTSAVDLHQAIRRAAIPAANTLVFDQVGPRERFITGRRRICALPAQANVYLAYADLLGGRHDGTVVIGGGYRTVGIFPSSRVAAKNLPATVVARLAEQCRAAGLLARIFLLEGERPELESAFPNATIVPRRFAAMVDAVRGVGVVISADSLPAHLAEHWKCPVFVMSPVDNRYWLPLSAFQNARWTLFDRRDDARLTTFLAECAAPAAAPARMSAAI